MITSIGEKLPRDAQARRDLITTRARAVPGGIGDAGMMSCDPGQTLTPAGDNLFFSCSLLSNGWPRIALVIVDGDTVYQGVGVPAMLPVLEASFAAVSGHALSAEDMAGGLRILEARYSPTLRRAGGVDVARDAALLELARLDNATLDFGGAEVAYRRALEIEERLFGNNALAVGESLAELALQVSNQGRFDEAAGLFRRAEPIIEAAPSASVRARLTSYLALDAANQRHYQDALKYARAATEMRRSELGNGESEPDIQSAAPAQAPPSRVELAHSLRIEAIMALRVDDLPSAVAAADEVLRIVADDPGIPLWWKPDSVAMMADVNVQLGRVVEAEREYREALVMYEKMFGETAPTALAELKLAKFYTDQELYPAAVAVFRRALGILKKDKIARSTVVPDQIVPFLSAASAVARTDVKQHDLLQAEMFDAIQLVNSDGTSRVIARTAARMATDNPALADLIRDAQEAERQRDSTRIELAAEMTKADEQRDAARELKLAAESRELGTKAESLFVQLKNTYADYAEFADPGTASFDEFKTTLRRGEAFLAFVIGQTASYALLVTPRGLTAQQLDMTDDSLMADVEELRTAMRPKLGTLQNFDLRASFALYRRLIGPLEKELAGIDHLIIAPSGALTSLPFGLLVTEPPPLDGAHRNYDAAAWLVRRFALSEIPSAQAFLALRRAAEHSSPAPNAFFGVGDPDFTGAGGDRGLVELSQRCNEGGPIRADLLHALPALHETANEVRSVARLMGAGDDALLLGRQATEGSLRSRPLDRYRILYFATHGLLPGELQCQSEPALALSPPPTPAATRQEDGLLEASEIAQLKLNADLVVLSACNTAASGRQLGGSALMGLADAFFAAGTRTVLATHWDVQSLATVTLLKDVFEHLARDNTQGIAQSLREAQLALIAQPKTAHPFYWAAFSVIGEGMIAFPREAHTSRSGAGHS